MVSIVREEWGCVDRGVVVIVVRKFRQWEEISPIVLSMRTEHVEVRLHPLVVVLYLSLCLRMVGSRKSGFDSEPLVQALRKCGGEGRSTVGSVYEWNPMKLPDVSYVELH